MTMAAYDRCGFCGEASHTGPCSNEAVGKLSFVTCHIHKWKHKAGTRCPHCENADKYLDRGTVCGYSAEIAPSTEERISRLEDRIAALEASR